MNAALTPFKRRYRWTRGLEILFSGTGIALMIMAVSGYFHVAEVYAIAGVIALAGGFMVWRIRQLSLFRISAAHVASWLNRQYPDFQQSADLLLAPASSLNDLQKIQQGYVGEQLLKDQKRISLPHRLPASILTLLTGALAWIFLTGPPEEVKPSATSINTSVVSRRAPLIPSLSKSEVTILPPSYTGIPTKVTSQLKLRVPERSRIDWKIQFSNPVKQAWILFSDSDSLNLSPLNGRYAGSSIALDQGFYTIYWTDSSHRYQSDFFPLEIIPDEAPSIVTEGLPPYTAVAPGERAVLEVKARISDDYGVNDAFIVATVAKGSGESVKFREEILRFTSPVKFGGPLHAVARDLDVVKLGLEPGDELYFYIEASDKRMPVPNQSRTETFFVVVSDTAHIAAVADEGLGVDLMPEYFRSQRQIIIDSEKLLKEKRNISKEEFNARSNELGYDQKVLRLRYGQFLGEEFESGLVASTTEAEADEDPSKQFGHQHDTKNEHNLIAEKGKHQKSEDQHDHEHKPKEGQETNPLDQFIHQHDNTDQATFFEQSVKAKLRAALTLLWDAELHLRLYAPQTSLPYQYKILKLLKEISNDSRIYVHRTGFDPPPLKEEKRLTGDLSEVQNSTRTEASTTKSAFPAIRSALELIEQLIHSRDSLWSPAIMNQFRIAGQELAQIAIEQPVYISSLSTLRGLLDHPGNLEKRRSALLELRTVFWQILPVTIPSPGKSFHTRHTLDNMFLKSLEAQP